MVEQHINPAGTVTYNKFFLPTYKRKTSAEFKKQDQAAMGSQILHQLGGVLQ